MPGDLASGDLAPADLGTQLHALRRQQSRSPSPGEMERILPELCYGRSKRGTMLVIGSLPPPAV